MKRCIVIALLYTLIGFQQLNAQNISKLTVPNSPAFSILNFEPSAIMRPTNARGIATDILNSFDPNGKLLMNLGLEVSPYWLQSHPGLTRATYLRPNLGQTFFQSLSFSAATVKDSASADNKLSAGFRFKLYNGEPVDELETASAALKQKTTVVAIINGIKAGVGAGLITTRQAAVDAVVKALEKKNIDKAVIDDVKSQAQEIMDNYTDSIEDINIFLEALLNKRVDAYSDLAKNVSDLLYQRKGFIVEFAGASAFNTSKNYSFERGGFWANASYSVNPDNYFTFTARYMFKNADSVLSNFDAGLGFLKKSDAFNISIEALIRHYSAEIPDININGQPIKRIEKDFTWRMAVQGSYLVTKDISINISLGKDFDSPFISGAGFFSILGLNYSLFSKEPAQLK